MGISDEHAEEKVKKMKLPKKKVECLSNVRWSMLYFSVTAPTGLAMES